MLRSKASSAGRLTAGTGCRVRDVQIYDHYAARLYRQALLTLGDADLAEQVVCEVIVEECVRPPLDRVAAARSGHRLAVSAYWRCQELAGPGWRDHPGEQRPSGCLGGIGPYSLSRKERGALALMLFGGLSYVEAGRELGISPLQMAGVMRAALLRLASTGSEAEVESNTLGTVPHPKR